MASFSKLRFKIGKAYAHFRSPSVQNLEIFWTNLSLRIAGGMGLVHSIVYVYFSKNYMKQLYNGSVSSSIMCEECES